MKAQRDSKGRFIKTVKVVQAVQVAHPQQPQCLEARFDSRSKQQTVMTPKRKRKSHGSVIIIQG